VVRFPEGADETDNFQTDGHNGLGHLAVHFPEGTDRNGQVADGRELHMGRACVENKRRF